jgi:hypothetical protein
VTVREVGERRPLAPPKYLHQLDGELALRPASVLTLQFELLPSLRAARGHGAELPSLPKSHLRFHCKPSPLRETVRSSLNPSKLMVNFPNCSPFDCGLKVMSMAQLDPAAKEPHEAAGVATNGPEVATLSAIELPPAGFVTVTVRVPVQPTATPSKSSSTTETFTAASPVRFNAVMGLPVGSSPLDNALPPDGAMIAKAFLTISPFPERETVSALPAALSLMVSVPVWPPLTVGLKVTLTVQLEPAARDAQEAEGVAPNGAEVAALTATVMLPEGFDTVSVCVAVEPTGTLPKLKLELESVRGEAADPVKLSV